MADSVLLTEVVLYALCKSQFKTLLRPVLSVELDDFALVGVETFKVGDDFLRESLGYEARQVGNLPVLLRVEKR